MKENIKKLLESCWVGQHTKEAIDIYNKEYKRADCQFIKVLADAKPKIDQQFNIITELHNYIDQSANKAKMQEVIEEIRKGADNSCIFTYIQRLLDIIEREDN